jgi:hypothetical protein
MLVSVAGTSPLRAMSSDQSGKALDRIDVDVEHPHAGNFAGRDADHGLREAGPPRPHLRLFAAGVLEAVDGERALVVGIAGENRNAQRQRVVQRGVEHGRHVVHLMCRSLAVGAQSILPLNLRMNRSLSHFACGGEGVGLNSSCSAMLSMNS